MAKRKKCNVGAVLNDCLVFSRRMSDCPRRFLLELLDLAVRCRKLLSGWLAANGGYDRLVLTSPLGPVCGSGMAVRGLGPWALSAPRCRDAGPSPPRRAAPCFPLLAGLRP